MTIVGFKQVCRLYYLFVVFTLTALWMPVKLMALTFYLPPNGDDLVGDNLEQSTRYEDTFVGLGHIYGLGFRELVAANPGVLPWVPGEGTEITLPLAFILPQEKREAIVLNLAEFRLYHFLPEKNTVRTYAVGIGREGWQTPTVETKVVGMTANPSWTPPASIRAEHAAMGDILPAVVRPGPDNPLGKYAVKLSVPSYLFHGSNKKIGIGMRVSHGCIRLYDGDIEELALSAKPGTPVRIINEPVKAGWRKGRLYLEAHAPLEEEREQFFDHVEVISQALKRLPDNNIEVDWDKVDLAIEAASGIPVDITMD